MCFTALRCSLPETQIGSVQDPIIVFLKGITWSYIAEESNGGQAIGF